MLSIIVAVAKNGVIGANNQLLWHISDDLKRFKAITTGSPIIMGRKTFESLGRPLPNRHNVVITRNEQFPMPEGVTRANSLEDAIEKAQGEKEIFIIGGGQIYKQSIELVDKIYITEVDQTPDGDTVFPEIDANLWSETLREQHEGFCFVNYERR